MPWNIAQKKFIRDNSRNTGPTVWDQDAQVSQPIDATGHDYHDEDIAQGITECLNKNGVNAMAANLDMGSNRIIALADGTGANDAVNKGQLDAVSGGLAGTIKADGSVPMTGNLDLGNFKIINVANGTLATDAINLGQANASYLRLDGSGTMAGVIQMGGNKITNLAAGTEAGDAVRWEQIQGLPTGDNLITAVTWDGVTLTHTRANGDFTPTIKLITEIKAGQIIRHKGANLTPGATVAVTVNNGNRWYLLNDLGGTTNINFIKPTGDDAELGSNYFVEGMIMLENGNTPATITLQSDGVAVPASSIVGTPSSDINVRYTLSYIIQRTSGDSYRETYVWSAF